MSHSQTNEAEAVSPESIAAGHEVTDATAHGLVIFTIALSVTLVATVLIALFLFSVFTEDVDKKIGADYAGSPLSALQPPSPAPPVQPSLGAPGSPLHETLPYQDWLALKAEYNRLSGTYGSEVMPDHVVHNRMPVEAAIQALADQGIAANTATDIPSPLGHGTSVPTPYSDGGRGASTDKAAAPGVPPPQN
jgi:hypothetical protein